MENGESGKKDKIEVLLQRHQSCRENDSMIIYFLWLEELPALKSMSGEDVLKLVRDGKLTKGSSIERDARDLRKKNYLYRGSNYAAKQQKALEIKVHYAQNK